MPVASREAMEPMIDQLGKQLWPRADKDGDGFLSLQEFTILCEYVQKEFDKMNK